MVEMEVVIVVEMEVVEEVKRMIRQWNKARIKLTYSLPLRQMNCRRKIPLLHSLLRT